ncbi:hypothetical protein VE00_04601 [Pseudogymnoascus sp. WSF 3629]|nr:hypothetical protein VE00_04601 [Pseudogymnoascus sp. WSF 3629]
MPRTRPPTTGYARLAQAEDSTDEEDEGNYQQSLQPAESRRYASIKAPRPNAGMYAEGSNAQQRSSRTRHRGLSNSSGVDIKAINARLERWADEIASKFKIGKVKGKSDEEERLEIHHSVFQAPDWIRPATSEQLASVGQGQMTAEQFEATVESVRVAIEQGVHPKMISQGSSGSYFARNCEGKVVGVFKPKDEEPYAAGNPKWNKWIHRNLFPCFFGRACLIPNLSYVSEAAAYTLDCRLETNLVPYTDIVHLSSKSFHYDFWARRNFYRKKKPFPMKPGSFQVFLQGFSDATIFLRKHPWPDQLNGGFRVSDAPARKKRPWNDPCRPSGAASDDEDEGIPNASTAEEAEQRKFFWTEKLQTAFREELEKLVILDYVMRNTDRGLDNWMIKVDWENESVSIVSDPPSMPSGEDTPTAQARPYRQQEPMNPGRSGRGSPSKGSEPTMSIGAIDNSLSWPWKHPDAWRSFPYGWLFLPVSLIGQPFSQKTREHFLPLLTSKLWWTETQLALRKVFSQDVDFQERMFARQISVMKGQAWNVVETLKTSDHGPLELTRRARVCVWDDLVDIPVAVPMRAPSLDMRRRQREAELSDEAAEEMDISVANAPAPADLIRFGSPPAELPNPNRFELSPRPSEDNAKLFSPMSPRSDVASPEGAASRPSGDQGGPSRPLMGRSSTQFSRHVPQHPLSQVHRKEQRKSSFSSWGDNHGQLMNDNDDLEGDLGYAAAEDMEHNQRKVIVERLETVKSKNPVFTWC